MNVLRISGIVFLIFTFSLSTCSAEAKEYSIPEIQIEVSINEDGTLRITEHRTYMFEGEYSWANYSLPTTNFSAIRDIRVSEGTSNFINLNTEEPGTFLVQESPDSYHIKWHFKAEDEQRVFTISYTLEGALTVGPEWSEFFWNYAASGREKSTDLISIKVLLPEMVAEDNLHAWVREPAWEIDRNILKNGFQFRGTDISRNLSVIIRTVFPTAVFNEKQVAVTNTDFSLAWARNDVANYREQLSQQAAERQRRYATGIEFSVIIIGLSILCFMYFYRKYGTRHEINLSKTESLRIPGNQKPAVIGWLLWNRNITGGMVTATLLDLSRRGYFTIEENEPENKWLASKKPSFSIYPTEKEIEQNMPNWEKDLLSFVRERVSKEGHKFEEVFNFSESEVSKWFRSWKEKLTHFCNELGWIDKTSYRGLFLNLSIQIILMLAGIAGIFMFHPVISVAIAVAFIASIASLAIIRRSPKGEEIFQNWKNYKSALKNAQDYAIPNHHLGLHFIYGIALGLGKHDIEQMFVQNQEAAATLHWIVILPGSTLSPASMASSFSNLAATGTISASGGSTSGGASAGAVGGGASGGAG